MQAAPIPANEAERLRALRELRLLDTAPEADYDNIVRIASIICETPIALVSLVDEHRQWFKARVGLEQAETGRAESFCAHAVATEQALVVPDAMADERFADNPLVLGGPNIRFYAGLPVRGPTGHVKGTLCVIDKQPRTLSHAQWGMLQLLASQVEGLLRTRQTEMLLKEREAQLATKQLLIDEALDTVGGTLWDWDLRTGVIRESERRSVLLGYQKGELREHIDEWVAMTHPDDVEAVYASVNAHIRGQAPFYRAELRQRTKSGDWKWFSSRGKVIEWDSNRHAVRIVGVAVNIDDQKMAEQQLREQAERAQAETQAKARFIATMAHEIRTPLNSVVGGAQLALLETDPAQQRASLQMVQSSAQHLFRLVNSVLDYSRIESGNLKLERATMSVGQVMDSLRDQFGALAARKGLSLYLVLDRSVPALVIGDPLRLTQVLSNFVSNAIKFTGDGSVSVDVVAHPMAPERVNLHFSIHDTGIGMTQEQMNQLFVPFTQADESMARRYGGTGLGLVIARRLVQLMDGELQMHSQPGKGTEVSCIIPMQCPAVNGAANDGEMPAPTAATATVTAAQLQEIAAPIAGARVLVVDDNLMNITVACRFLETAGLVVDSAASGEEALQRLQAERFDFVLMDLYMPGMGGVEAARQIRVTTSAAELPIVACSATVTPEEEARCEQAGMQGFVPKPVDARQLVAALVALRAPLADRQAG